VHSAAICCVVVVVAVRTQCGSICQRVASCGDALPELGARRTARMSAVDLHSCLPLRRLLVGVACAHGFWGKRCVSGPILVVFQVVGLVPSYRDHAGLCGVLCRLARVCALKATRGLVGLAPTKAMGG
jgi:hypothetical protein